MHGTATPVVVSFTSQVHHSLMLVVVVPLQIVENLKGTMKATIVVEVILGPLCDSLGQLHKGSTFVGKFSRKFKYICDQLVVIGHPVDDTDKTHWFLSSLRPSFETFSTATCAKASPILYQVESHAI